MLAETKMDRSLLDYVIDGLTGETKTDVIKLAQPDKSGCVVLAECEHEHCPCGCKDGKCGCCKDSQTLARTRKMVEKIMLAQDEEEE